MEDAIEKHSPDQVFFLGDMHEDCELLSRFFPRLSICEVYGNNDYAPAEMSEKTIRLEGIVFFVTHGHRYGVKNGPGTLAYSAAKKGAAIALYGHTHEQAVEEIGGVLCVNPGSAGYGERYLYAEIANGKIKKLENERGSGFPIPDQLRI